MEYGKNYNRIATENYGAFGRIAQPYSGAAPYVKLSAKLGQGDDFYNRSAH